LGFEKYYLSIEVFQQQHARKEKAMDKSTTTLDEKDQRRILCEPSCNNGNPSV
jgi:hypothetical protein